jgi:hypothetical protein
MPLFDRVIRASGDSTSSDHAHAGKKRQKIEGFHARRDDFPGGGA